MRCDYCREENEPGASICGHCDAILDTTSSEKGDTVVSGELSVAEVDRTPTREQMPMFAERYIILELIGRGGMGIVYRVHDCELREELAIKVLQPHLIEAEDQLERFKTEVRAARRVTHENVIRIHDFGVHDEEAFISMELALGGSLVKRMKDGVVDRDEALRIAIALADGLTAAHKQGVVHRDMKPANVLFTRDGDVKIVDFGIARLSDSTLETVGFLGTPSYMAPEQGSSSDITPATDVYSLGVVLYEMFSGLLPFDGESLLEIASQHANDPPVPLRAHVPDIPLHIELIVLQTLAKDPSERYPTAAELGEDLRAFRDGRPPVHVKVMEPISQTLNKTPASVPRPEGLSAAPQGARPKTALLIGIGVLAVILAAIGGALISEWWGNREVASGPAVTATAATTPSVAVVKWTEPPVVRTRKPVRTPVRAARTAVRTAVRTPAPKPTSTRVVAVAGRGTLTVTARPWAEVWIDGTRVTRSTPLFKHGLQAGRHTLTLINPAKDVKVTLKVNVKANHLTHVKFDVEKKKATTTLKAQ